MGRIYYTSPDGHANAGYFTSDSAEHYKGDKDYYNGSNLADVNTRNQNTGQDLYRTAQGRWVLLEWSAWTDTPDEYTLIDDSQARDWLILNREDQAAEKYFGPVEDERGPGRPEIGAPVQIRLGDLLAQVDSWASTQGVNRSEAIRQLIAAGLDYA